jgi:hypothetical protein
MVSGRLTILVGLLLASAGARADDQPSAPPSTAAPAGAAAPPPAPVVVTEHYGGEVLVGNVAAFAAGLGLSYATGSGEFLLLSLLGGPVVHAAHQQFDSTAASLGLHVFMPIAGAFVGYHVESCSQGEWFCGLSGLLVGGLIGVAGATVLDCTWLASSTHLEQSRRVSRVPIPTLALSPRGGLLIGLAGRL